MVNLGSPGGEKDQSKKNNDESFEDLLQKKFEVEQELDEKYRKIVTLLKSDLKGSTDFQRTRGDLEAAARLNIHTRMLKSLLEKHGGRILNEMTDGADAVFENAPEKAVKTAIEFMQQIHKYNEKNHPKVDIRIAMNHGPVIAIKENHYDGLTISAAARVEQAMKDYEKENPEMAKTALIFISGSVYNEIRNSDDIICRWVGQVDAKGLSKPLELYRVVWDLKQEQSLFEALLSSKETRGADSDISGSHTSLPKKRNVFVVEIAKVVDKIKISGYDKAETEQITIRQYEEVEVNFKNIEDYVRKITSLLNQATHKGCISKEILKVLKSTGKHLYDELFNKTIKGKFAATTSEDLIINIDDHLVHIPWELLYDGTSFLCLRFNMGRIVSTRQKISEGTLRPMGFPLKMLVLSDPRNNLKSANNEGHNILKKLVSISSPINVNLKTGNIKSAYVAEKICNFDIVHYAGHADYDPANPAQSGWLLFDKKLVAEEIRKIGEQQPMPALVFSNACQSGQTDKWELPENYENNIYGIANAFLLTGVHHYVGTFWDILDGPSSHFAMEFYEQLSGGKPVGEALRLARMELIKKYGEETIIWASYMLYGDPSFSYIRPMAREEIAQAGTKAKEHAAYALAGDDVRSGGATVALTEGWLTTNKMIFLFGGIAAIILIVLSFLFFKQTKQTEDLLKSVQQTQVELAGQQAERNETQAGKDELTVMEKPTTKPIVDETGPLKPTEKPGAHVISEFNVLILSSGTPDKTEIIKMFVAEELSRKKDIHLIDKSIVPNFSTRIDIGNDRIDIEEFYGTIQTIGDDVIPHIIVLANIETIGKTELKYYGQSKTQYTASVSIKAIFTKDNKVISGPLVKNVKFTDLDVYNKIKEVVQPMAESLAQQIERFIKSFK